MKKFLTTALVTSLISGIAFAATVVSSANVVGYVRTMQEIGLQIITSPFEGGSLNDWAPTNGLGGDSIVNSDNIYVYIPGSGYKSYWLAGDVGEPDYNYKWIDDDLSAVATNEIPSGQAVWYRNRSATTNEHIFSGDVVMTATITNSIAEGLQLISFPFSASVNLNNMALTNGLGGDSVVNSDNIYVYIPGSGYKTYWFAGDVGEPDYNYKWIDDDLSAVATNSVPLGEGFWYRCRKQGGYSSSWIVPRPYLND